MSRRLYSKLSSLSAAATLLLLIYGSAPAKDLGVVGATYPIAEPDALAEIEERAAKTDWSKFINKDKIEKTIKNFKPPGLVKLPRAAQTRTYHVDMTYTLDYDIPDGRGGIIYPKGYTFNPLDYVQYKKTIIVIDGSDPAQVDWFERSQWARDINSILILTDGSYYELSRRLRRQVYYAVHDIPKKFQLQAVPAVIRQSSRVMEVTEIDVSSTR